MLSKITLVGLHEYGRYSNDDLFELLELPEGIDKDILINEILKKGRSFALLYPDFHFMKLQIGLWSSKWQHNFERWITAYLSEYNALYNLDVTSTISETGSNADNLTINETIQRDTSTNGESEGSNSSEEITSKSAYDASTFQNIEKVESSGGSELTSSGSSEENVERGEERASEGSHEKVIEEIRQGNQGVTMSQEMLLSEFNAWKWNLYDHISDIFINEFCIMIYD